MAEHDDDYDDNSLSTAIGTKKKKKKNKVRNFTASVVLVLYCVYCGRGISYYIHYIPQVLAAHLRICMSVCGCDSRLGYGFTWV